MPLGCCDQTHVAQPDKGQQPLHSRHRALKEAQVAIEKLTQSNSVEQLFEGGVGRRHHPLEAVDRCSVTERIAIACF